jgi:CRP-like cAMP-binding protein
MSRSGKIRIPATIDRARCERTVHLPQAPRLRRPVDKLTPLRDHAVFCEFPPAVIEHLGTYMTRRTVPQGAMIFAKGDPGTTLMAVLSGSVRISVLTGDGHEAVLNVIEPDQVFGEVALLDGRGANSRCSRHDRL